MVLSSSAAKIQRSLVSLDHSYTKLVLAWGDTVIQCFDRCFSVVLIALTVWLHPHHQLDSSPVFDH